jgi:hypothetical protein
MGAIVIVEDSEEELLFLIQKCKEIWKVWNVYLYALY